MPVQPNRQTPSAGRPELFAGMAIVVIGMQMFIVQPGFVGGLVSNRELEESVAGLIASAEMFGMAATTILAAALGSRIDWRWLTGGALLALVLANGASAALTAPLALGAARTIAGLAAGLLLSLGYAVVGRSANPDRWFGYLIMAVLLYGAAGLFFMPSLLASVGMTGLLGLFAAMAAAGFLAVSRMPRSGLAEAGHGGRALWRLNGRAWSCLAAVLAFFLGQGVVWAFLVLIGTHLGIADQAIANGLTIAQIAGIGGAFAAATLGARLPHIALLIVGTAGSVIPLLLLAGGVDGLGYSINVTIFNFAANLLTPLLIAIAARMDSGEALVQKAVALQMIGLAVGPAIAAPLLGADGYGMMLALSAGLFLLSFGAASIGVAHERRICRF